MDTVTGQQKSCDHIVGLYVAPHPEYGETDRLVNAIEELGILGERFSYCPLCGTTLIDGKGANLYKFSDNFVDFV